MYYIVHLNYEVLFLLRSWIMSSASNLLKAEAHFYFWTEIQGVSLLKAKIIMVLQSELSTLEELHPMFPHVQQI